jgi:hypothetical protein
LHVWDIEHAPNSGVNLLVHGSKMDPKIKSSNHLMPCVGAVILETLQRSNDRVQQSPLRAVSDTSEFLRLKDAAVVDPVGLGSHGGEMACREQKGGQIHLCHFGDSYLAIKRATEMAADTNPLAWSAEPNT